jgi:hypothetical protein
MLPLLAMLFLLLPPLLSASTAKKTSMSRDRRSRRSSQRKMKINAPGFRTTAMTARGVGGDITVLLRMK